MSGRKFKAIPVLETEGYGLTQERNGSKIEQPLCRFQFPRFPLDKTEVLYALAVNINVYFPKFLLICLIRMMMKELMQKICQESRNILLGSIL